jgi:hypothetical protein
MKHSTILLLTILLTSTPSSGQTHDTGIINGAEFEIIIPENWNNRLVMYAHGYEETEEFGGVSEELVEDEQLMEEDDGESSPQEVMHLRHQLFEAKGW